MSNTENDIAQLMAERGISRKSAVQFLRRQRKVVSVDIETTPGPAIVAVPTVSVASLVEPAAPVSVAFPEDEPNFVTPDPVEPAPAAAPAVTGTWNPALAVEMYKQSKKVVDIAVAMGYPKGKGQNRTRAALIAAGVYKG